MADVTLTWQADGLLAAEVGAVRIALRPDLWVRLCNEVWAALEREADADADPYGEEA